MLGARVVSPGGAERDSDSRQSERPIRSSICSVGETIRMIRVLVADDHAILREGLRQILGEDRGFRVTGEASCGRDVLERIQQEEFDVLLLDISMPGCSGLETLEQVRRVRPSLPVLILSMHPEDHYAVRALRAGAAGYLTKRAGSDQLVAAIEKVVSGGRYVSQKVAEVLAESIGRDTDKAPHEALSNREYEVFCRLASGQSVTQIAESLILSVKTISTNRSRILKKMAMSNNGELMRYAIDRQLVN